jgi:hypothetical protein
MEEVATSTWKKRIERPIGVYLITIYDFVAVGLIPLLAFVFYLRHSDTELSLPTIMLSVGLYVLVMAFSVWAFVGDNIGRWLLLSAVTLAVAVSILDAILIVTNIDLSSGDKPRLIVFVPRGIFALAANWWYLNKQSTNAYYKQDAPAA